MSIFRRDPEPASPSPPSPARPAPRPSGPQASQEHTHIATGSKVVGEISGSAELQIDGLVEGKINLQSRVVIGPKGKVEGEIRARSVEIGGKVVGNVHGSERVEVKASGRLEGDMAAPQVHIAEGAFFTGKVEMGRPAPGKDNVGKDNVGNDNIGKDKPPSGPVPGGGPAKPPEAVQGRPQGDKLQGHQGRSGK